MKWLIAALLTALVSTPSLAAPGIRAVLAGVGAYRPPVNPLRFTVADARLMEKAVGGASDRVTTLTTDGPPTQAPTQANILRAVREQASKAQPDDIFIFFFAGHGIQRDGKSYAAPLDVDTSDIGSYLSISELRELIRSVCKAKTKLVILDCCHSGSTRALTPVPWQQVFAPVDGMVTIAASAVESVALESPELRQGLLTYYLVRGMLGDAAKGGVVTLGSLKSYVVANVNAHCAKLGQPHQNPQFILPPDAESAPVSEPKPDALAALPPPGDAAIEQRPRLAPGLVVAFATDEGATPNRALANAMESEMRRRFVGAGFPVVVPMAEGATGQGRSLDFTTATAGEAGTETAKLNSRFLVRGTITATEIQQDSSLANIVTVHLTLRAQLLDTDGRVLAEVSSDDANGRPVTQAAGRVELARNRALATASQRVFERMRERIADVLKKENIEVKKPGA